MDKINLLMKKKFIVVLIAVVSFLLFLIGRVAYIQLWKGEWLQEKAFEQQTRDRLIKANRGAIYDRNMNEIATTKTVASISVINSQIEDAEQVAKELSEILELDYDYVKEKVDKKVALERIKTKVDRETANEIRDLDLKGVKIDEDILRVYPYNNLVSHAVGFVGKDNQGILGLEAKYDEYLKGSEGKIMTETDAKGRELDNATELRQMPQNGYNLVTSLDLTLQQYAENVLDTVMETTKAKRSLIILMNPHNGEILAMANKPDFNLNEPFTINNDELSFIWEYLSYEEKNEYLNQMWRNFAINDTYEPGSTFKIITTVAGIEEGVADVDTEYVCNGHRVVGNIKIKCWRSPLSHGVLNLVEGVKNSCNPVFMEIAENLGAEKFYEYLDLFGFNEKTGIDLPGEATGIFHDIDNVGPVELATMSFGQSFQITPIQLIRAVAIVINGGHDITPHLGVAITDENGEIVEKLYEPSDEQIISKETSEMMRLILEDVVYTGTGNKAYIPGLRIGGKTATSEKLPRRSGKYIASFLGFAPADDPQVIGLVLIDEPVGAYYGGQIAAPVMQIIMANTLPYLGVEPEYYEKEMELEEVQQVSVVNFVGLDKDTALSIAKENNIQVDIIDMRNEETIESDDIPIVTRQMPREGDIINQSSKVILYID